jgi:colicin import membrane protein
MAATLVMGNFYDIIEIRWTPMVMLSICFHLIVFFIILFVPESTPSRRQIEGIVYEVNLVEMSPALLERLDAATVVEKKEDTVTSKDTQARRISVPEKEKTPLVVGKKTVTKKDTQPEKPKLSSSQLIDSAISRIEKKVKTEETNHVAKVISELEKRVEGGNIGQSGIGGRPPDGITIRIYQMEVESRIKGNWSYPVAVQNLTKLQAIMVLKVKQDGTILESRFKEHSGDTIFDQSVLKAIEKSDPLPPFPEGYIKSDEEFEIRFNLEDLEDS